MSAPPRVSLAIPLYNEREVLPELLARVCRTLDGIPGGPHEVVLVDDGSTDGTAEIAAAAAEQDPRIVLVCLSRNFGHQHAITAALDHVEGDVVVVMDGDLQDPPEAIPDLLAQHAQGYDVVYAQRSARQEAWWLRLSYFVFYRVAATLSDIRLPLDSGDFALLSRRVVDAMRQTTERHRYLRGLRTWVGFRQIGMPLVRAQRHAGRSKYTPFKLLKLAGDGIFAFSTAPLRAAIVTGAVAVCGSLVFAAYAVWARLVWRQSPQGFTALIVAIVFWAGVQLLLLGVVGEYVGRIYEEVKRRPHYLIDRIVRRR